MWLHVPTSCLSALVSDSSTSASSSQCQALARSVTWRGKHRPAEYLQRVCARDSLILRLSGLTSQPSTLDLGAASWISSLAESRASHSQSLENSSGIQTNARSLSMSSESWKPVAQPWFSSKTYLPGCHEDTPEDSARLYADWVTRSKIRSSSLRRALERRIAGSAFLYWPTPMASDCKSRGTRNSTTRRRSFGKQVGLEAAVKMWPTPTARDYKTSMTSEGLAMTTRKSPALNDVAATGGSLNPAWVEWLMGCPINWTASEHSGTEPFRLWWQSHSASLSLALKGD